MSQKDLCIFIRTIVGDEGLEFRVQEQVAAETEDAAEFGGSGDTGEDGHGAALGETAEHDAGGGDAAVNFGFDERVEVVS